MIITDHFGCLAQINNDDNHLLTKQQDTFFSGTHKLRKKALD
jgi:hypothetical protein